MLILGAKHWPNTPSFVINKSLVMEMLFSLFYIIIAVYHLVAFWCEWICWSNFPNPGHKTHETVFSISCVCDCTFKLWFVYRLVRTVAKLSEPNIIGRRNFSSILLPELNFHVLEAVITLAQSSISGEMTFFTLTRRKCVDSMFYNLARCCCCGAVMQFLCFLKNLCGYHGEQEQSNNEKLANLFGVVFSFMSLRFAYGMISSSQNKRFC